MAENGGMIGFIRGVLTHKEPPLLLVDVQGVGYELEVPMSTLFRLPAIGAEVQLRTQLVIRDDQQSVEGFIRCVETEDKAALTKLPGIGRKTAERLILDMRDRIETFSRHDTAAENIGSIPDDGASPRAEAFNALVTLGYKPAETRRMLEKVATENQTTEEILRSVLRAATP
jgi:Holliday junction DNA helicase RuvA